MDKLLASSVPGVFLLECPACKCHHAVATQAPNHCGAKWTWNGSMTTPTFYPSLLVSWGQGPEREVCHSWVENGFIRFLSDCTHALRGQTLELPFVQSLEETDPPPTDNPLSPHSDPS